LSFTTMEEPKVYDEANILTWEDASRTWLDGLEWKQHMLCMDAATTCTLTTHTCDVSSNGGSKQVLQPNIVASRSGASQDHVHQPWASWSSTLTLLSLAYCMNWLVYQLNRSPDPNSLPFPRNAATG
jgi:hypothetical protein